MEKNTAEKYSTAGITARSIISVYDVPRNSQTYYKYDLLPLIWKYSLQSISLPDKILKICFPAPLMEEKQGEKIMSFLPDDIDKTQSKNPCSL